MAIDKPEILKILLDMEDINLNVLSTLVFIYFHLFTEAQNGNWRYAHEYCLNSSFQLLIFRKIENSFFS